MMVVGSEVGETFGGETTVLVPTSVDVGPSASADFALQRVAPNPMTNRLRVSFALATSAPAKLELLDVAGRSWLSREVGAFGPGAHSIELSLVSRAPAGLYFLRLTQGGRMATTNVVVLESR